jgi:hypothetical protein
MENSWIKIAADRTTADPEDPDHWDKLPWSTRAAAATGKDSSSRHSTQNRDEKDSDEEILMYYDPAPLTYAFPSTPFAYPMPSSAIPDDMVVDATLLNQIPPPTGGHAGRKRVVKPPAQHTPATEEAEGWRAPPEETKTSCLGVSFFSMYYFRHISSFDY